MHEDDEASAKLRSHTARDGVTPVSPSAWGAQAPRPPFDALSYEIEIDGERRLLRATDGALTPCHQTLYRRDEPCDRCPVLEAVASNRAVEAAWPVKEDAIHLVRAIPNGAAAARCERVVLSALGGDAVRRALVELRIARAKLSPRETEVLEQLRLGGSLEDVGAVLGISPHTVKFHTRKLLAKLGADSRHDLLRVLG